MAEDKTNPQFTLYTHHTCPAAFKVAHILSLLHLTYKPIYITITKTTKDQKEPWFLSLNPNGRLPVLIDHHHSNHIIWESASIITYLLTLYDPLFTLHPSSPFLQSEVNSWVALQVSGQGPTIGQAFWFGYWHSEILPSAYNRYVEETKRILGVLEGRLEGREWLVGNKMSVADVGFLAWYEEAFMVDIEIEREFPRCWGWIGRMKVVPEIVEGSVGREMIAPRKLWERGVEE
ncbi:glutathione S-transferase C-terminal-like protein [Mollisia scopiformis]|uniref:Glutathione S-transferase C-terminal-like protein n=1 Tax=Mollisia scopiformis TaxID=149040 RepID=A0A194XBG6_MOLSC|nr:glutathione S-transferase C-terminal-like protein [Mollisia scopiformis]KUJ17102.1 glutathione S-transferase C-terminal-like protein [Mollisia scopiformis]